MGTGGPTHAPGPVWVGFGGARSRSDSRRPPQSKRPRPHIDDIELQAAGEFGDEVVDRGEDDAADEAEEAVKDRDDDGHDDAESAEEGQHFGAPRSGAGTTSRLCRQADGAEGEKEEGIQDADDEPEGGVKGAEEDAALEHVDAFQFFLHGMVGVRHRVYPRSRQGRKHNSQGGNLSRKK